MNELRVGLHAKDQFVHSMHENVSPFKMKISVIFKANPRQIVYSFLTTLATLKEDWQHVNKHKKIVSLVESLHLVTFS